MSRHFSRLNTMFPSANSTPRVALITGAAQRVGAVIARHLHGLGMNVAIHCRQSKAAGELLCKELNQMRANSAVLLVSDLLLPGAAVTLVNTALQSWQKLDVLVNNASSFYPTPVGTIDEQHWDDLLGTNLKAPLFLSQAAAPHLKATNGCIVNITDIHADRPLKNHTVYCVAKAGLVMLTKSLARELAPDVRVNGVAPGAILWPEQHTNPETQEQILSRIALKRQGAPEEIAKAVAFLVRDADYLTGQIITVDGGRTLSN